MYRQKTLDHVRLLILESHPALHPSRITEAASLTHDLDLDPCKLGKLLWQLHSDESVVSFMPWYTQAVRPGQDTVGSLVDFLLESKGMMHSALKAA